MIRDYASGTIKLGAHTRFDGVVNTCARCQRRAAILKEYDRQLRATVVRATHVVEERKLPDGGIARIVTDSCAYTRADDGEIGLL